MKRLVAVITAVSFCTACTFSKMTSINSDPSGATVRMGGQEKGVTPANLKLGCTGVTNTGREIELVKDNYRPLKTTMEYKTLTKNIVWSVIFFWPALFIWGKCPEDSYNFKLERGTASLDGKSTLTVVELESPYAVFVGEKQLVQGQRMVLEAGWHELSARIDGRMVPAAEVLLEPSTDHVVSFGLGSKPH